MISALSPPQGGLTGAILHYAMEIDMSKALFNHARDRVEDGMFELATQRDKLWINLWEWHPPQDDADDVLHAIADELKKAGEAIEKARRILSEW